jgi:molybdopterin-binding protein
VRYLYSECGNCEVYGYCSGTEEEHKAYMENFAWHKTPMASDCGSCISLSYCTQSEGECETLQSLSGPLEEHVEYSSSRKLPPNTGLVNRLSGQIVAIDEGEQMTRISLKVGENLLTTIMPREEFRLSGFKLGNEAAVAIKAFNVKLML